MFKALAYSFQISFQGGDFFLLSCCPALETLELPGQRGLKLSDLIPLVPQAAGLSRNRLLLSFYPAMLFEELIE